MNFTIEEVFGQSGLLAAFLPNYEIRNGQVQMAREIHELLNNSLRQQEESCRTLVVEAETGVGKTLAYLVPAILSGQKVIISTATITLQDQIIEKEIPLLSQIFSEPISVTCIKGRENYVCKYRWYQYVAQSLSSQMTVVENPELKELEEWLETTTTGDRADFANLSDMSVLWKKICSTSHTCLGGECPEYADCFINTLRKKAAHSKIIVVNHHLFFSDLALRQDGFGEILPRYQAIVFDEAHHLENVASMFFGISFSHYQVIDLVQDITQYVENDLDFKQRGKISTILENLRVKSFEFTSIFPENRGKFALDTYIQENGNATWLGAITRLHEAMQRLAEELAALELYGEKWTIFAKRVQQLQKKFLITTRQENASEEFQFVFWYERREKAVIISATPVHIAELLNKYLYSTIETCIMTSATLAVQGNFEYCKKQLGLADSANFLQLTSPFDYRTKTLCYIPEKDFPEPSNTLYSSKFCDRALQIIDKCKGRTLVLFTSVKHLELAAEFFRNHLQFPLLVQGQSSKTILLQQFRTSVNSVLLAVASFWEGVDIPGESLSCVLIDKLPFEVPSDPVVSAKILEMNNAGGRAFFDFQIPRAVLTLRQGIGRLMRTANDRGIIAIMDVRLFTKAYGRVFLKSLPPFSITRELDDIDRFWQKEKRAVS